MIEPSSILYIEYKSLSNESNIAEIQKDIIVQVIKINKEENEIIIENTPDKEKISNNKILSAKCIQCMVPDDFQYRIIPTSIKKNTNNFINEISFDLINSSEKKIAWKIELTEKKTSYYLAAKENISPNTILDEKHFVIASCTTTDIKCAPKNAFISSKDAHNQIINYKNKKSSYFIRLGQEIDPKQLSQAILIRAGEKIKVTYNPNNSLNIQTFGKSLSNGGLGEIIRVQITDWFDKNAISQSMRVIEGTVIAPGEVEYVSK